MKRVCLDANIWVKVLTEEPDSPQAQDLVIRFIRERTELIAPAIMKMEVGSILRKKWSRKLLDEHSMNELWLKFLALPIVYVDHKQLYDLAWGIAEANRLVHLYNAIYLALSEGIEFWTADERLANSVTQTKAQVRLLGN
ncbi:type II toxin-antitoxin system VapC family toxin [Cohnella silvisoli]|uniref:Type II toxin-antitoxin system VapC family toxin n=1 Tax=Cohnella silvisoli TaxID=2873699 RepID=A0ABV1KUL7_9BACL|nr:type II toxin-antitoxin system VapC family toxin [Cohnella silvisoli]MCD9023023.1 type II toxin-antitoxin system VapC family toxin [Cohnella silvisoli]